MTFLRALRISKKDNVYLRPRESRNYFRVENGKLLEYRYYDIGHETWSNNWERFDAIITYEQYIGQWDIVPN